jgi:hypothetical protein
VGLAEYPVDICVSAKLAGQLEAADRELFEADRALRLARAELDAAREAAADPDAPKRPRRSGETAHADLVRKVEEAEERARAAAEVSDEIRARMEDNSVRVVLRGKDSGVWGRWVAKHPARDEDDEPAAYERDRRLAAGFCNIDALIADLYEWVAEYNGESPSEDWWEFLSTNGLPADMANAASRVVQMHEQVVDLGKSRLAWLAEQRSANSSE